MKLCMVGTRGHYGYVLTDLEDLPHIEVVGLSAGNSEDDITPLSTWCNDHDQKTEVYDDYKKMFDEVKPDIAVICSNFERHTEMCVEAFERNIHVFCEKPVAITLTELTQLRSAHNASDATIAPMMGLRYHPAFYTAWQLVKEGAIGDVCMINARKSYKLGERPDYYGVRDTYGGTIPWVGSHAIDWIYWFSGEQFKTVHSFHTDARNGNNGTMEMSAVSQFELSNNVLASASMDYLRPATAPTHGDDRIRIGGTDGVVEVRNEKVYLINGETEGEQAPAMACDRQMFVDFVNSIEGRGDRLVGPEDTFAVTEACLLARQSADEGRAIDFPR